LKNDCCYVIVTPRIFWMHSSLSAKRHNGNFSSHVALLCTLSMHCAVPQCSVTSHQRCHFQRHADSQPNWIIHRE
jgi:hypothetical protein